jgi:phage gpG-like protein
MSKFNFNQQAMTFRDKTKLAAIDMMRASKQYFGEAFEKEQLDDQKWPEVERRKPGSHFNSGQVIHGTNKPSGKPFIVDQGPDYATRKILRGTTGQLKYKTIRADSSITNYGAVSVMTNPVPYAAYVNDGTPYQPARPFMKHTDELSNIHLKILAARTGETWRQL